MGIALQLAALLAAWASVLAPCAGSSPPMVIAVDVGTESTRAAVIDAAGRQLGQASCAHRTSFPQPGWAEQEPSEWWEGLGEAVRGAREAAGVAETDIAALCLATTSCTVLALDAAGAPLCPALLWMDQRAAAQAEAVLRLGRGDPALKVNCDGAGPVSAEWMLPKALWLKEVQPDTWAAAASICECQDWLNFRCTGELVAAGCNVATRWHCDGAAAVGGEAVAVFAGRPSSLLRRLGLEDLEEKWPRRCVATGAVAGTLTEEAAAHLGLQAKTPLVQGAADAFVGLLGLGGAGRAGAIGLITGSSHLSLAAVPKELGTSREGTWGAYSGAPLPHLAMAEGGQASTGSALQWARALFGSPTLRELDEEAAALPIGAEGVLALETFQGARTPTTDPLARGALLGLSLRHRRGHVWRALLEAVCLGSRATIEALAAACGTEKPSVVLLTGGIAKSPLWLQMHADALGLPVAVCEDAVLLGGACLAAAASGVHADLDAAVAAMVREARRVQPDPQASACYDALYRLYERLSPTLAPLSHRLARGGLLTPPPPATPPTLPSGREAVVVPSLLAADGSALGLVAKEVEAVARWVHVDIFDGSHASNFAISALAPSTAAMLRSVAPTLLIDAHLGVVSPERHIGELARMGAHRITFQYEAVEPESADETKEEAVARLARAIHALGARAGVCIAPSTPASAVRAIVKSGLVEMVNVLGVEAGWGAQPFQPAVLDKVSELRRAHPQLPYIAVDGGINADTAPLAAAAGANVLIAGTSLLGQPGQAALAAAFATIEGALLQHGV